MIDKYNFEEIESNIAKFWAENNIKERANNKGGKPFRFLDGPPYTSGKVHIGTAWNKSLKDSILRYKRMTGHNVWDRAGYDMHGLPTANAVMKKLLLKDKQDILAYGVDKFIDACMIFSKENMAVMNEDFKKMGIWMDFDNAYQPITKEYIEGEWWLIKQAHEKERLYEGERTMTWCSSCQTALAKHELEYENITDKSIFVKLKIKNTENEYLVIWTTTPWTIPFNLAVMVNPELDYLKVDVGDEIWVVAKALAGPLVQSVANKKMNILDEFKGESLEGTEYEHPFEDEIPYYKEAKAKNPKVHTILLSSEYVDTSAGSGLVHCAPGCGPEDYEVGHQNNIDPFNNISESGVFPAEMGKFKDLIAKKDDKAFIEALEEKNAIIASTPVEHDYAHCWRCHKPVIFKLTKQWFFKVEDLKEKMIEFNQDIEWVPKTAFNAFDSWLKNLRDNSITKQRFWGTPLPVWRCDQCGKYDVVGSVKELEELSKQKVDRLHKPWIDQITIPCHCGDTKKRIPDILDVWVDSGCAAWNHLGYPQSEENFHLFPAEFILEGKDQIRGWFNLLMVASTIALDRPSYENVYMHGFVQDAQGRKMSKSLGNYILPEEIISKYGADLMRYYLIGAANPGLDMNYNFDDMDVKQRNILVLWNVHKFLIESAKTYDINPSILSPADLQFGMEEKYMLSKLNTIIKKVTESFDSYHLNDIPILIEELYLDLSRTYIQLVRDKLALGSIEEKKTVLFTIYKSIDAVLKMFATTCPYVSEAMYLNLKESFNLETESIHLSGWPEYDNGLIDEWIEMRMSIASTIVQSILNCREKLNQGVRWPLSEAIVISTNENVQNTLNELGDLIKNQTNIKSLTLKDHMPGVKLTLKPDFAKLGADFKDSTPKIIPKLLEISAESMLEKMEQNGFYEMDIDGETFNIVKEHVIVNRETPEGYAEGSSRFCKVYVNSEMTPELEAEGYAREVMRRVQSLRKNAGLQKSDTVELFIEADGEFLEIIKPHIETIKDKVGANNIILSPVAPEKEYKHSSEEKVKGMHFKLFI